MGASRLWGLAARLAFALALLTNASCWPGRADPPNKDTPMTQAHTLAASFGTTPDELQIDYTLTNRSEAASYVIDVAVAVERGGAAKVVHRPRVELHPDRQLWLVNRITPPDRRRSYAIPPTAYGARLEPGATRTVQIKLPLPLIPANLAPTENVQELTAERVTLVVAVVPSSAVPQARELDIGGQPLWQLSPDAATHQVELRADGVAPGTRVRAPK